MSDAKIVMPTSGQRPSTPTRESLLSDLRVLVQDTQPQSDPSARLSPVQQLALFGQMLTVGSSQHVRDCRSAAVQVLKDHIAHFGSLDIPLESLLPLPVYATLFGSTLFGSRLRTRPRISRSPGQLWSPSTK